MHKVVFLISSLSLLLSGCAVSQQQALDTQIRAQIQPEVIASQRTMNESGAKCGYIDDIQAFDQSGKRDKAAKVFSCMRDLMIKDVRPYAKYPHLFDRSMSLNNKTINQYRSGQIDLGETLVRLNNNKTKYRADVDAQIMAEYQPMMQQAVQADAMQAQRSAAMMAAGSQMMGQSSGSTSKDNMTCNTIGGQLNCRQW